MIEFQIPNDISVLSMIHNCPQDNEDFQKDGWVYVNGKPVRKWFIYLDGQRIRCWEPKLSDLSFCEAKRWKAVQYQKRQFEGLWESVTKKVKEIGGDLCCRLHDGFARIRCYENEYGQDVIGWNWEDENCQSVFNQELGDTYFAVEKRTREINERRRWFGLVFMRSLELHWWNSKPDPMIRNFHYVINGRDYWFTESPNRFPTNRVEIISYPEDVQTVEIS